MAGYFSATGTQRELGRTGQAIRNYGVGSRNIYMWSDCWSYYSGSASNIYLSSSFAGRYYPFTY